MHIPREIEPEIFNWLGERELMAIIGPRQSGKTTLVQDAFREYKYISLESIDNREMAISDPRGFLEDKGKRIILDEIQKVPSLFSYIQEFVDRDPDPAQYVLTGSHHFLVMEKIHMQIYLMLSQQHLELLLLVHY